MRYLWSQRPDALCVEPRGLALRFITAILGDLLAACQELEYYAPNRLQDPEVVARVSRRLP